MNARLIFIILTLAVVIASALGVVYARHQVRIQSAELAAAEERRDALIAEWSRLQLEQAWLADAGQIESKARDALGMQVPQSSEILVVKP